MPAAFRPVRVLHLEDSGQDAELVRGRLESEGLASEIVQVGSRESFEAAVTSDHFDIVLCDYNIPGYDGIAALKLVQQYHPTTPVVLLSGSIGEDEAVKCLQLGATDYLIKERLNRLGAAVRRALEEADHDRRRRQAEEALRESEERFRLLVENSSDLVGEASLDGRFLYVSPNFKTVLGYDVTDLLGTSIFDKVHRDDLPGIRAAFKQPEMRAQFRYRLADGSYRWFEITGRVFAAGGGQRRAGFIARDITERRVLEDQLRQSQKMDSIGQLAGGVAHDFNNIMTVIQGQASLLDYEMDLPPAMKESLAEIIEAADRAAGLIRQLLTFSRKQIMQPCDLDLNAVVRDMTRMLSRTLRDDISLVVNANTSLPLIYADKGMIEQILLNLAVNARDAMPDGGRLEIETASVSVTPGETLLHPEAVPGPAILLRVSDTGRGIPVEIQHRIFEPFFTTKEPGKGTGLGLATVHGIVRQHRGWIKLQSAADKGTTFRIFFPIHTGAPAAAPVVAPVEPATPSGGGTVLLVDDDAGVRRVGRRMLERLGYEVLEATSGIHALELLDQWNHHIDLLVTDMVMPGGIKGNDLAQRLQAKLPNLRVLFTSGYSVDLVSVDKTVPMDHHFLQKPYSTQQLAQAIRECFES